MGGIAFLPEAEVALRARFGEMESCWINVDCGQCGGSTSIPILLLLTRYHADVSIGAYASRLVCKRCGVPPVSIALCEEANDTSRADEQSPWRVQLAGSEPPTYDVGASIAAKYAAKSLA